MAVELLGGGAPIYLLEKRPGSAPFRGATQTRAYDRHWTPVHLDFAVDDLRAARARVLAAGAVPEGDVGEHVWGQIAYFSDPFGAMASVCCSSRSAATTRSRREVLA